MKRKRKFSSVVGLVFALASTPILATVELEWVGLGEPPSSLVFRSVGVSEIPGAWASPSAATEWPVEMNVDRLADLPDWIDLNLPDRGISTLTRDRGQIRGPGAFVWSGHGDGCSAIFTAYQNRLMGTISCVDGSYRIALSPTGARLTRHVFGNTPPEAMDDVATVNGSPPMALPEEFSSLDQPFTPLLDDRIDVLILYTPTVTQTVGSANVQMAMQHLADQTQQAMINSASSQTGFPLTGVHLVHAQEVPRGETETMGEDLLYLQGLDGTSLPVNIRDYWGADIVMLVRESKSQGNCGKAYTPGFGGAPQPAGFAEFALGVSVRDCDLGDYSFQHEFGHILGGNHNPESNSNTTPLVPWAQAHWENPMASKKGGHRSLLSYKFDARPPDPECEGECPTVLHYANDQVDIFVDGVLFHTGGVNEENARVIALVSPYAWHWRSSVDRIFADGFE
jgi:hypothetical protein